MNKTKIVALTMTVALLAMFISTAKAVYIPEGDDLPNQYEITLASVVYDPTTNVQNWTYNYRTLSGHAISHINIEFDQICDPPIGNILAAGPGSSDISESYTDYFPHTSIAGIKIDTPTGNGQIWFTLQGEWPVGTITFYVKADDLPINDYKGEVAGPECRINNNVPEVPLGPVVAATSMIIAFGVYAKIRKPRVQ